MTIENNTEQANVTVGKILSQARERMGLTQEAVAERLCLKVSTVKEIEQDIHPAGVEPTFLRGYIRLYARMVSVPESEIQTFLKTDQPLQPSNVSPMQSYSLGKKRKKREGWLMKLTWLIVVVLIAMVGVWWWQDYNAQKDELNTMASQSDLILSQQGNNANSVDLSNTTENTPPSSNETANAAPAAQAQDQLLNIDEPEAQPVRTVPLPNAQPSSTAINRSESTDSNETPPASASALVLNFSGQCWLEIRDANNKILFSGMKNNGDKLELDGALPYRLNIGAPANVAVQFQGNAVDLSRFIKAKRSAKLQLP
ncbi:cytoskeleton protein RodZ [Providencia heimbachae]|uniref:Putative membrane protein n=1 Tax=Providencia heimbachae ATCC 35613 TaxID=1354272 RepID=A0A1B7JKA9_9GAMM|nr:cytoskeleton protein RodZ [Providencia heimbachae]MDD9339240.1 cytoskeleton protein RodZ [Providencia heimbachae]OAT48104.1 putative membrane protein [Providencia heimbachae ATCC 35613]QCJ69633.1 cytoskeleton protein RodZ [Providencia heimbachae]SQH12753.1 Cytoskeleton protein rodZ [Providencia heimbachae]